MKFEYEPPLQWAAGHACGSESRRWIRAPRFTINFIIKFAMLALVALNLCLPQTAWAGKDKGDDDDDEIEIELEERRTLRFSTIASSYAGPGAATVSPSGILTTTGYAIYLDGNPRAAEYKIKGPKNGTVLITLPTTVTVSGPSGSAVLTSFVSDPPAGAVQLNSKGKLTLKMGATLNIPTGQAGGEYTGAFTVYVDPQ